MEDSEIKKKVAAHIKRRLGVEVDDKTILFGQLQLIGMDADNFMDGFSKEFDVDVRSLKFEDYFIEISSVPFYYWYLYYFQPEKLKRKEFNISHLVDVVKKGEWFDPPQI